MEIANLPVEDSAASVESDFVVQRAGRHRGERTSATTAAKTSNDNRTLQSCYLEVDQAIGPPADSLLGGE